MATWYVANNGDNGNAGTQIAPFQTFTHALSVASPGDSILLKRGDTFVVVNIDGKDGTALDKFLIGAYGSGPRPKITGFKTPGAWVNEGGNIWSYTDAGFVKVNMLREDGVTRAKGRWPQTGYYDIQNRVSNTQISDSTNLASAPNFVGGELVAKKTKWIKDVQEITAQTSSTLTTAAGSSYSYAINYGYFVQNHINCLTYAGAWCYDDSTKTVYLYSTTDPASKNIQISYDQYTLYMNASDFYVFEDITFEGSYEAAAMVRFSTSVTFKNCKIQHHGDEGLRTYVSNAVVSEGSTWEDINNNGLNIRDDSNQAIIRKSKIKNIAMIPGASGSGDGQGMGIIMGNNCDEHLYEDNIFDDNGYIGLYFRGSDTSVLRNLARNCCQVKGDGAGLYSFGNFASPYTNILVERNICIGNVGSVEGTPSTIGDCAGIYLDDNCQNITVRENLCKANSYGIYLHNNQNCGITDNYILNNLVVGLRFSDDNVQGVGTTLRMRNITATGNQIKSGVGALAIEARTIGDFSGDDPFLYGNINNQNIDAAEATPFRIHLTNNYDNFYDLAGWRSNALFDLNSTTNAIDDTEVIYLVNETEATANFPLTKVYKDWDNIENDTGTISLDPNESVLLFEVEDLYFYTADVLPAGYGTAEASPSPVREDEEVTFTATPASGKQFVRWTEDGFEFATQNPLTFTPLLITNRSADLVAEFEDIPPPTFTLTVQESPGAGGSTVEVSSGPYEENDSVQVQASPASGYIFSHWEIGGSSVSTDADYTFAMPAADTTITAVFVAVFTVAISQNIPAGGSISEVTTGPYEQGDTVQVQATPATGYRFLRWEEGGLQVSESELYMFAMPEEDRNLVAVFELITYALTLTATPGGSGTLTGAGNQVPGAQVAVSASPNEGYSFAYWMEDGEVISTDPDFTYTMPEANSTLTAFFESTAPSGGLTQYQLTISTTPESGGTVTGANFYTEGDTVQVTATPSDSFPGNRFLYWKKDDQIVSYDEVYSFTMPAANTLLVAHFELSETSTAQAMDMTRDYIRISLTPDIPDEGIIEMEGTLEFEQTYGTGTFTPIAEYLNPYLHELSRVDFHVDRALLGKMVFHRPNLALGLDTESLDGIVHRYRLRHALLVDGVQEGGESLTSSRHAWLAGRPYTFPDVNPWEGKAYLWLTTRPMVRPVYPVEKSIFYVLPLETGEYTLEQTIHYKNTVKETVSRPLGTQERYRPFVFRFFLPEDWEDILQIELRLAGRILSEEVLTLRPQANPRYPQQVFYGNSLGGFDSFCFAGKKEQFSEASAEIFESNLQPDHDRQEGTLSAYNQLAFDSLILRTGYISLPEKTALKDMILRNHTYMVSGSSLQRIVLQPTESFDQKDGEYLHAQEYRARLAHNNSSYYGRDPRQ
ncbi:InlB B-repeat-containing protein [Cyclobacterium jeungdonense]|uniref:Right-handed parallel beta-helix repeat-containing protein n=1 Tax=Cyclobacterium jeungdonense TaxID=708087 RepID=A0ABT8C7D5_9BACT|nr:right-handed parallel beta-helix repeat-containing protein [Cyclobacterium jeungdonense]MDN3688703.1 right-handed parallel beta-helix repeat-containing protein [Cyclobacterium jeungdonense]